MKANEYQKLASRTIGKISSLSQERHALHGIYQKTYQGHYLDREHTKKELGDLLWFIAEYCTANK